jgi:UDP-glucose 4-epimerase
MSGSQQRSNHLVLVTGAAGFIGSHLVDSLLAGGCAVIGVDDLSRGVEDNLARARVHPRFKFFTVDLADESAMLQGLVPPLRGLPIAEVWHMAANSDISAGVQDARIDHCKTFMTTFNTLLLMKELEIPEILFASTSAVYGEHPGLLTEQTGPLLPISNYGAMKLAAEGLISAAVEAYLKRAFIFRFPNVVGPRLTHGILYDLLNKLRRGPDELEVLGDGTQKKPYLHASDLIDAMFFIRNHSRERVNLFNVGPSDEGATVAEIARAVLDVARVKIPIRYTGGDRGWVGDVPRFRYSVEKLATLGWRATSSSIDAVHRAVAEMTASFEAVSCR